VGEETRAGGGPLGGRHGRARELAARRDRGEELSDFEERALAAHLAACPRCRGAIEAGEGRSEATVPAPVVGGQERPGGATVGAMEAASSPSGGGQHVQEHIGSKEDAMGQDKRRQVVGQGYGPSKARQLAYYGIAVAFIVLAYIGAKIAIDELDKAPANNPDKAPWAQPDAPQQPAKRFQ
jgi:hypothetical protein